MAKLPTDPIIHLLCFPEETSASSFLHTLPETVYVYICSYKCISFLFAPVTVYYTLYVRVCVCSVPYSFSLQLYWQFSLIFSNANGVEVIRGKKKRFVSNSIRK